MALDRHQKCRPPFGNSFVRERDRSTQGEKVMNWTRAGGMLMIGEGAWETNHCTMTVFPKPGGRGTSHPEGQHCLRKSARAFHRRKAYWMNACRYTRQPCGQTPVSQPLGIFRYSFGCVPHHKTAGTVTPRKRTNDIRRLFHPVLSVRIDSWNLPFRHSFFN